MSTRQTPNRIPNKSLEATAACSLVCSWLRSVLMVRYCAAVCLSFIVRRKEAFNLGCHFCSKVFGQSFTRFLTGEFSSLFGASQPDQCVLRFGAQFRRTSRWSQPGVASRFGPRGFRYGGSAWVGQHNDTFMKILEQLKILDSMIVDNTTPPATSKLRNYLSTIIEQAETEGDLPATIEALKKEKAAVDAKLLSMEAELAKLKKPPPPNWGSKPYIDLSTD